MKIIIRENYDEVSSLAYRLLLDRMRENRLLVLGLPTGSTPIGLYKAMTEGFDKGDFSYKNITTFNLDEYGGMEKSNPNSYYRFMQEHLFEKIDAAPENINIPSGTGNLEENCLIYDRMIELAGGIDLQVLGVGGNGHIGFNEPGTPFEKTTHLVTLTDDTRQANSRFFASLEDVPRRAATMGIKSIMNAREIILIAAGEEKAGAVSQTVRGRVNTEWPSSVLQLHPNITLVIDDAAASLLN